MKHLQRFEEFINEGKIPEYDKLKDAFGTVFYQTFGRYTYQDDPSYDYSQGYIIHHYIVYNDNSIICFDKKIANIFTQNKNTFPRVYGNLTYYEPIGDSKPKDIQAGFSVQGNSYGNFYYSFVITDKTDFRKEVNTFIKNAQKESKNIVDNEDLLKKLFGIGMWKRLSNSEKHVDTRHQGLGSQSSIHVKMAYEDAYSIKDFDKLFGNKEKFERFAASLFQFRNDKLFFDWKNNVMTTNGTYTETYD